MGSQGLLLVVMSQAQLDPGLPWDRTFGGNAACDQCTQHLDSGLAGGDNSWLYSSQSLGRARVPYFLTLDILFWVEVESDFKRTWR